MFQLKHSNLTGNSIILTPSNEIVEYDANPYIEKITMSLINKLSYVKDLAFKNINLMP